ncbi:TetR family transcriptional regulator [Rhodococcus erythropolis]|uniref:TetR/AcrR family transcriptional regulator n=1 Tax=Rhodococcus erythropolis TaxID=1833 RepID=UPI00197DE314|nr:TetR family transcriptional regulator [Rhodococcus erythropolis]QSE41319.1 TetR family transcriptional regulator [Rhodococcus erythropolis]
MSTEKKSAGRTGRRPGISTTRQSVLRAARACFADRGFAGTTVRSIAADAGVDAALVVRLFGSKDALFVESMSIPAAVSTHLAAAFDGVPSELGRRLTRAYLQVWDDPDLSAPLLAMLRSAMTNDIAAAQLGEFLQSRLRVLSPRLNSVEADRRVALAASQLLGVAISRHAVGVASVTEADLDTVVDLLAPGIQQLLVPRQTAT